MTTADELRQVLQDQRAAFLRAVPDYRSRMQALATLRDGLHASQRKLLRAVSDDFGGRAEEETLMLELLPLYDQIRHAQRRLKSWMRRKSVPGTWFLQPSRAFVQYQPLGVIGVIGAWNYQLLLTLGPVVDAIAAGNHVILKPSEITARSADVIADIIADSFRKDYIACVTGGPDLGSAFAELPFDHLFFTGSQRVGKLIMRRAADYLTPLTLELGGKSPVIVHEAYPLERAAERIMVGKLYNAGQTCVAPDYLLLPAGKERAFEQCATRIVGNLYPRLVENHDYTRIVSLRHYDRLIAALEDATANGARSVVMNPANEAYTAENKVFPPTLLFNLTPEMIVMQEEIFGPILPVLSCRNLEEAISFVNARPRPLALYYFDENSRRVDEVLRRTLSGGATVNDCIFHLGQHSLPFGGVGASGMGHYHGFDGFAAFSKKRGVMVQRRWAATSRFHAPFTAGRRALIDTVLRLARW